MTSLPRKSGFVRSAIVAAVAVAAFSTARAAPPAALDFLTLATLVAADGSTRSIGLVSATRDAIRYRVPGAQDSIQYLALKDGVTLFVPELAEYTAAMELYRARNYQNARKQFAAVKDRFRPIEGLEDSISTLAAYQEMECLRKLGDLDALAAALKKFSNGPLSRDYQNDQLELDVLWDTVRTKDWQRLLALTQGRAAERLPGEQRAQVAWCEGLALEGLGRPEAALVSYQTAITADAGDSEEITRQAARRVLAIYHQDPQVRAALAGKGGADGELKLAQARAMAALFELSLGNGAPLPKEFWKFREPVAKK
jgi:tetratricopeptide (TPR) repeat protein